MCHQDSPQQDSSGIAIDFRLDGKLFNIRRLPATKQLCIEQVPELQYADDCAFVAHTPEDLQTVLAVAVRAYSRMGLTVNTTKTEVVCQWSTKVPPTLPAFSVGDEQISLFKYLGSILAEDETLQELDVLFPVKTCRNACSCLYHQQGGLL